MVPQLAQALVSRYINQPTYMQGVTDVVTMLVRKQKLPRNTYYTDSRKRRDTCAEDRLVRRLVGNTEFCNSGHFSLCFQHTDADGTDYAIKVSLRDDDGAVPYYKWLWENKKWVDSPHFPELFFVGKVRGFDVCVMEWLPDGFYCDGIDYWAVSGDRDEVESRRHEHTKYTESLLEAGEELAELGSKLMLGLDIHSENLRDRGDGVPVLSDPFGFIRREH